MLELARCYGGSPVLMSTLVEREDLPRKYLHALLTSLRSAGLVRTVRGAGGGFLLARAPAAVKLSEVVRALEGPLSLVDCVADEQVCEKARRCTARRVWKELSAATEAMLDGVTLADLIEPQPATDGSSEAKKPTRGGGKRSRVPSRRSGKRRRGAGKA